VIVRFPVPAATPLQFRRRHRLTHAREFQAVYAARVNRGSGPLVVYLRPGDLPHWRLGLSVGRRVGGAVERNRIKRLLREAFRLSQAELPLAGGRGYDMVINVRPHRPLHLTEYTTRMKELAGAAAAEWERRRMADPKRDQ
jgi:ribonuclease P protein component